LLCLHGFQRVERRELVVGQAVDRIERDSRALGGRVRVDPMQRRPLRRARITRFGSLEALAPFEGRSGRPQVPVGMRLAHSGAGVADSRAVRAGRWSEPTAGACPAAHRGAATRSGPGDGWRRVSSMDRRPVGDGSAADRRIVSIITTRG
jgi:hypothetical protein